jgi:hypothetical protein
MLGPNTERNTSAVPAPDAPFAWLINTTAMIVSMLKTTNARRIFLPRVMLAFGFLRFLSVGKGFCDATGSGGSVIVRCI